MRTEPFQERAAGYFARPGCGRCIWNSDTNDRDRKSSSPNASQNCQMSFCRRNTSGNSPPSPIRSTCSSCVRPSDGEYLRRRCRSVRSPLFWARHGRQLPEASKYSKRVESSPGDVMAHIPRRSLSSLIHRGLRLLRLVSKRRLARTKRRLALVSKQRLVLYSKRRLATDLQCAQLY